MRSSCSRKSSPPPPTPCWAPASSSQPAPQGRPLPGGQGGACRGRRVPGVPRCVGWRKHLVWPWLHRWSLASPGQPALHAGFRLHAAWSLDQVAVVRRASSNVRAAGGWGFTPGDRTRLAYELAAACCGGRHGPTPCLALPQWPSLPSSSPTPGGAWTESLKTQNMESAKPAFALISCAEKIPTPVPQFPHQGNGLVTTF